MPSSSKMMALAAAASTASASFQGFNYGATYADGRLRVQQDFESLFSTAQKLEGTDGKFNSARLYTMIQGNTDNQPISAIPAAIKTKTSMLFGLWASAGQDSFNNEIDALEKTIEQYCDQLDGLVAGISVGSEDLYRDSPIGIEAGEFAGAGPQVLAKYIKQVRDTIKGTCLSDAPIGHVDTWTAYVNETNKPLIEACDWLGMDAYPYFEDTKPNSIGEAKGLFEQALANTQGAAGGKDVWITETGYPTKGKKSGDAVANTKNARTYWEEVGCPLFGNVNTWWYTLQDSNSDGPITDDTPSFGVVGDELSSKPKYNLSCKNVDTDKPSSSSASSSKPEATSSEKAEATSSKGGNGGSGSGSDDSDKDVVTKTGSSSAAEETKAESSSEMASAPASSAGDAIVTPPAGQSTVSTVQIPAATPTAGNGGPDSGSGSGNDNDNSGNNGGDNEDTPDTTDSGSNKQLKGSFGAVIVALGLTFFAL